MHRGRFQTLSDQSHPPLIRSESAVYERLHSVALIAFGLLTLLAVSCRHARPEAQTPAADYGTPGPGKIMVTVRGDVAHPGDYWVSEGSTLLALESVLRNAGDGRPISVTVSRQVQDWVKQSWSWTLDSLDATSPGTELASGDVLRYYARPIYIPGDSNSAAPQPPRRRVDPQPLTP
jgi:hypothetical protein